MTTNVKPTTALTDIDPLLDGFESVPADAIPFITLDTQKRFYLNASLRKLIGIKAHDRVALAYNSDTRSLAVLSGSAAEVIPNTSYFVDNRHYMSARRFCAEYRYDVAKAPYTFVFQRAGTADGVYLFKLTKLSE